MKMTYEGIARKVDGAGRISLPKNLRSKYRLTEGTTVEYFTCQVDNKDYICISAAEEKNEEPKANI